MKQITLRLEDRQTAALKRIARASYNTPAGLIRYSIDQLILAAQKNGGSMLPVTVPDGERQPEKAA